MLVGSVRSSTEAIVPLQVRGPRGVAAEVDVIIDTGFDSWLTLPRSTIETLELSFREEARYNLADGSEAVARLFSAEVHWLGRWQKVLVLQMEGSPLLGMTLMRGCYLGIEVIDFGRVEIRPLAE